MQSNQNITYQELNVDIILRDIYRIKLQVPMTLCPKIYSHYLLCSLLLEFPLLEPTKSTISTVDDSEQDGLTCKSRTSSSLNFVKHFLHLMLLFCSRSPLSPLYSANLKTRLICSELGPLHLQFASGPP